MFTHKEQIIVSVDNGNVQIIAVFITHTYKLNTKKESKKKKMKPEKRLKNHQKYRKVRSD